MKKLIFVFYLLASIVSAVEIEWEREILKSMLESMIHHKSIKVYTQDRKIYQILQTLSFVQISRSCKKADFALLKDMKRNSCQKPTIVFDYRVYQKNPDAVGVFFWQKGRPTIRFSSERLSRFGLNVDGELKKFVSAKNL